MVAEQRRVPDIAIRSGRDAIGTGPLWRFPGFDFSCCRIDTSVDPVLTGKPENPFPIESRGVEIGVGKFLGKWKKLHSLGGRIETRNRVLPAFGNPGSAVRPDDHAVRGRTLSERDLR